MTLPSPRDDVMEISFFYTQLFRVRLGLGLGLGFRVRLGLGFETILAKDNCLRIPKMYQKLF